MSGIECSVICLFKVTVSKYQVDSQSTTSLLPGELNTGMPYLMMSFGKNIANDNKYICFFVTDIVS